VLVDSEPVANRLFAEALSEIGLPLSYAEICERFVGLTLSDCMRKVEGDLGNFFAFSAHLPMNFAMTYKQSKDYTIVLGFASGSSDDLDPYDEESVQAALRQYLPGATVLSVMHYDWVSDPYSRGTWATYRSGWVDKYYDQFQKESGRIFFGSGDHGEGWRGTIDSAIGAGSIAARKANDLLS
jgi:3',5'-cyclic AMP phosphodiesterase CpdA